MYNCTRTYIILVLTYYELVTKNGGEKRKKMKKRKNGRKLFNCLALKAIGAGNRQSISKWWPFPLYKQAYLVHNLICPSGCSRYVVRNTTTTKYLCFEQYNVILKLTYLYELMFRIWRRGNCPCKILYNFFQNYMKVIVEFALKVCKKFKNIFSTDVKRIFLSGRYSIWEMKSWGHFPQKQFS